MDLLQAFHFLKTPLMVGNFFGGASKLAASFAAALESWKFARLKLQSQFGFVFLDPQEGQKLFERVCGNGLRHLPAPTARIDFFLVRAVRSSQEVDRSSERFLQIDDTLRTRLIEADIHTITIVWLATVGRFFVIGIRIVLRQQDTAFPVKQSRTIGNTGFVHDRLLLRELVSTVQVASILQTREEVNRTLYPQGYSANRVNSGKLPCLDGQPSQKDNPEPSMQLGLVVA